MKTNRTGTNLLKQAIAAAILLAALACPALVRAGTLSTDVISMFPQNVGEFAYADLRQARALPWFPQLKEQMLPARFRQFEKFLAAAGINPDVQVEEVAWALIASGPSGSAVPSTDEVVGVALGNFQPDSAQAYFRAQKLPTVKVRNYTLYAFGGGAAGPGDLVFCFLDSSTAAFGQRSELEKLIALRYGEGQGLLTNTTLSPLILHVNGSSVVWAVLDAPYTRLAMQQLVPQTAQFPQAQTLISTLRALTISISTGHGVQASFEAVCASPDTANTFAALLSAGLLYQRYQIAGNNPDLAALLDGASIAPAGDRLNVRVSLTDDQVMALIRRNTFALGI